ncbi:MAG: altronate dehydratase family protein [Synergistaceae bacterium]|jgi:altronate hydrolase|nr:altronate dehydratase family protein [Synergistaceae bacterium]
MRSVKSMRFSDIDNVLVLPEGGEAGQRIEDAGFVDGASVISEDIPAWHKVACEPIASGSPIIKHGYPIGSSIADILPGAWVHVHNAAERPGAGWRMPPGRMRPSDGDRYARPGESSLKFRGYRREEGRPGVRNDLWVISSAGYAGGRLGEIVRDYHGQYWMDSVKIIEHPSNCPHLRRGFDFPEAILSGFTSNPNAAGVLLIVSEDEEIEPEAVHDLTSDRSPRVLALRNPGPTEIAEYLDRLGGDAPRVREDFSISSLCVGIKPTGGDPRDILPANLLMGRFSDWFVSRGGTILSVAPPETLAFEDIVAARILKGTTLDEFMSFSKLYKRHAKEDRELTLSSRDIEEGLTTITEKILLTSEGSGRSPITAVLRRGDRVRDLGGVQITYASDDDLASSTALTSGGVQIILSVAEEGACVRAVVPTIEISSEWRTSKARHEWTGFGASVPLNGEMPGDTPEGLDKLAEYIFLVASGDERTRQEKTGSSPDRVHRNP